jgi:hypothetical protein
MEFCGFAKVFYIGGFFSFLWVVFGLDNMGRNI